MGQILAELIRRTMPYEHKVFNEKWPSLESVLHYSTLTLNKRHMYINKNLEVILSVDQTDHLNYPSYPIMEVPLFWLTRQQSVLYSYLHFLLTRIYETQLTYL